MKLKKAYIWIGLIILIISQSSYIHIIRQETITGRSQNIVHFLMGLVVDIFLSVFSLVDRIFTFLLSWQGVLLIAVLLFYTGWKKYILSK
ncbi:MAG: hypothetical protein N2484_12505 [Clostridia bacterium]|nr:hypothetical protein [Clostridia bacterium]